MKSVSNASLNVTLMTNTFEVAMSCRFSRGMCNICSNIYGFCSEDVEQHHEHIKSKQLLLEFLLQCSQTLDL